MMLAASIRRLGLAALHWLILAALIALGMAAAGRYGLHRADWAVDSRALHLLGYIGWGSFYGILGLGLVARPLLPRRRVFRLPLALILTTLAVTGGMSMMAVLGRGLDVTEVLAEHETVQVGLISLARLVAVEIYIFLALDARLIFPHALVVLVPGALWMSGMAAKREGRVEMDAQAC